MAKVIDGRWTSPTLAHALEKGDQIVWEDGTVRTLRHNPRHWSATSLKGLVSIEFTDSDLPIVADLNGPFDRVVGSRSGGQI